MLTRSGLSIKKVPVKSSGPIIKQTSLENIKDERVKDIRKPRASKHKSMHYMSFVTRFYLYMRVPGLDITGTNHRETLRFLQKIPIGSRGFDKDNGGDIEEDEEDSLTSGDNEENVIAKCDDNKELDELILGITDDLHNKDDGNVNDNANVALVGAKYENKERDWVTTNQTMGKSVQDAPISNNNDQHKKNVVDKIFQTKEDHLEADGKVEKIKVVQNAVDNGVNCFKYLANRESSVSTDSCDSSKVDDTFVPSIDSDFNISSSEKNNFSPINQSVSSHDRGIEPRAFPGDLQIQLVSGEEGQNLVKCPECDKAFSMVSAFIAHMKSHFKCRNMCYLCGKIFTRSWLLTGHLRTHSGERPYICTHEGCQKAFADKSNLRSHLMIHSTNKKSYNCDKCGRAFAQKRYLHKHVQEVCRQPPL